MAHRPLIFFDPRMLDHQPGEFHPEIPERLQAIAHMLDELPPDLIERHTCIPASRADIERIHDASYIDLIDSLRGKPAHLDGDTSLSPGSVEAAYLAAGAGIQAINALCNPTSNNQSRRAFCLVRPPGHHAEHDHAMGFCIFNNVAIAAAYATEQLGIERVLIVDWDVHHGNGTQHSFKDRADILAFNIHQTPLFPETGTIHALGSGHGTGYNINIPFPPGRTDSDYAAAFTQVLFPIAHQFKPQLVLVSAGFDAHQNDSLGSMNLTTRGFADLCAYCIDIAELYADGRIALFLEGGYDLTALTQSVRACIQTLASHVPRATIPTPSTTPSPTAQSTINHALRLLAPLWSLQK